MTGATQYGAVSKRFGMLGVLAFAAVMAIACESAEPPVAEETPADTANVTTAEEITLEDIVAGTDSLQNRDVMLRDAEVLSPMGQRAFWVNLPNRQPYLIKMGTDVATGVTFEEGDAFDVTGRILLMSDSVISDWIAAGVITANQESEARFATSFLQATDVRPAQ